MGSLFMRFLLGGIAGLLGWMLWEPAYPKTPGQVDNNVELFMTLTAGLLIGATVAGLSGYIQGGKRHTFRGIACGGLFGLLGISLGYKLGGGIAFGSFGTDIFVNPDRALATKTIARTIVLLPVGAFLGLAVGGATLNARRTVQGVLGGLIGGAVSGLIFDTVGAGISTLVLALQGQQKGDTGSVSRALTFLLLGATISLFIGLVERFARSAWLRLNLGRNEGKEWSIDSAQTFIGRSEGANVPLFGDPNIAPIHASIQKQGPNYILIDGGSPMGTLVNGQRVQQALLMHGAAIQIGGFVLQFLMKNQSAPVMAPEAYRGQAFPVGGFPGQAMPGQPMPGQPVHGQAAAYPTQAMPGVGVPMGAPTQVMPSMPAPSQPTMAYGAAMGSGFNLFAIDGPLMGQRFPVNGAVEIGREGAGIRMPQDANASRRHAAISPGMGGVAVQDLGSTNGTFVNGQRVSQATAGPGDMIKVGSTTFRVEPA